MSNPPKFIDTNAETIRQELRNEYQSRTNKILTETQVESVLLDSVAYVLSLFANRVQFAGEQMLVEYASGPLLDALAKLVGVDRLDAQKASTTLQFELVDGHGGVTIPAGTRVATNDGQQLFLTSEAASAAAGQNQLTVQADARTEGTAANGFGPGSIATIIDPLAFVESVANTTTSAGGADSESDAAFRERIVLAPAAFSNAGSVDAYRFFARTANPLIVDVSVFTPVPGTVNVYPMILAGETPSEILDAVLVGLSAEKVRPLSDLVQVFSPTIIAYDIEVNVTLYEDAPIAQTMAQIEANLQAYATRKRRVLGLDIIRAQISAAATIDGVYNTSVVLPSSDVNVLITQVAQVDTITANFIGTNNG